MKKYQSRVNLVTPRVAHARQNDAFRAGTVGSPRLVRGNFVVCTTIFLSLAGECKNTSLAVIYAQWL